MTALFLEAHPNIGLDRLDHVAKVYRTIGVWEGARDQDFSILRHDCGNALFCLSDMFRAPNEF